MQIERIRLRDVGPLDIRVRIDETGVCHSDLSLARGVLAQPLPGMATEPEESGTSFRAGRGDHIDSQLVDVTAVE
jgi:S-(hydroxymethyl)glutathione dehydrogenase / alcohol dehydrogenase